MEKKQKIVNSNTYLHEKEKKSIPVPEKEKIVPKKDSLQENLKINKGSRNTSRKRKSDSNANEISESSKKKRRNKRHSQSLSDVIGQKTCRKVDRCNSASKTHSDKKVNSSGTSTRKLPENYVKTNDMSLPTPHYSKTINFSSNVETNSTVHQNGCSNSKLKNKKTPKIRKKFPCEKKSGGIDDSTSQDDYWYSKLDELARNSYIPDSDEKIAPKKVKNLKNMSENVVPVMNVLKLDQVPIVNSNDVCRGRLDWEKIKSSVLSSTSPKHCNSYDPNLCYDACDTPPPEDMKTPNGVEDDKSSPTFTDSFESVNGLGQNICSDDDDLPEFLTNSDEHGYTPKEGDLIWLKQRKYPFWPAKILRVSKFKPRVRLKVNFFGDNERYSVNYSKKSVLPYFHPQKDVFTEKGKEIENKALKEAFLKGIKDVTLEAMKKASVSLSSTPTEEHSFELNSSEADNLNSITPSIDRQSGFKLKWKQKGPLSLDSKITDKMLDQCKKRKEKLQERNKALVEFIKTDKVKKYLFGVYRGQIESESHQKFHASATEQNHLRFKARSFGYLEDEEQITEVFEVLKDYYKEVSGCEINNIDYIIDVWFPEAVVYSLIKKRRLTESKAWEVFEKPKKISKAEEILEHQQLIRSASPETNMLKLRPPPKVKLRQTT